MNNEQRIVNNGNDPTTPTEKLYRDIRHLIESARLHIVTQVNQALVLTYWHIGKTVTTELLNDSRAEYGSGFSYSGLTRMLPGQEIVATLSQQLSWSHFVEIIKINDEDFNYGEIARIKSQAEADGERYS
jgi:hypothetical protein